MIREHDVVRLKQTMSEQGVATGTLGIVLEVPVEGVGGVCIVQFLDQLIRFELHARTYRLELVPITSADHWIARARHLPITEVLDFTDFCEQLVVTPDVPENILETAYYELMSGHHMRKLTNREVLERILLRNPDALLREDVKKIIAQQDARQKPLQKLQDDFNTEMKRLQYSYQMYGFVCGRILHPDADPHDESVDEVPDDIEGLRRVVEALRTRPTPTPSTTEK